MAKRNIILSLLAAFGADGLAQHGYPRQHAHALSARMPQQNEVLWHNCSESRGSEEFSSLSGLLSGPDAKCLANNLIFIRTFKTGSTSMASIIKRIASRHGLNGVHDKTAAKIAEPFVSTDHFARYKLSQQKFVELHQPQLFVSMLRHPVDRLLSHYYWSKSKKVEKRELMPYLQTMEDNFMYNYLKVSNTSEPTLDSTLDNYLFVGLSERFDESVVALASLLGVESWCDVLYGAEKVAGEVSTRTFVKPVPIEEQPQHVREYIASEEFQKKVEKDRELYNLANIRLSKIIMDIGESKFNARLRQYQQIKKESQQKCAQDSAAFETDCYFRDIGCHYKCFDEYCAANMNSLIIRD